MSSSDIAAIEQGPFAGGLDYPFVSESALSSPIIDAKVFFDPSETQLPLYLVGQVQPGGNVSLSLSGGGQTLALLNSGTVTQNFADGPDGHRIMCFHDAGVYVWLELIDNIAASATEPERLDIRTYYPKLPVVEQIEFVDCDGTAVADAIQASATDEVQFVDGNNAAWSPQPQSQSINLNVIPGSGLGRVDNCSQLSSLIYTVAGVAPVGGNLQINGDACYRIEPEVEEVNGGESLAIVPGKLNFYQDCEPCCDCSEYEAVALAAMRQNRVTDYVQQRLQNTTNAHNELVKSINSQLSATADLFIRAGLYVIGEVGVSNCRLHLSMTYRNSGTQTQNDVALVVTVEDDFDDEFYASNLNPVPTAAAIYHGREFIGNVPVEAFNGYGFVVQVGEVKPKQQITAQIVVGVSRPAVYRACLNLQEPLDRVNPVCHAIKVPCE